MKTHFEKRSREARVGVLRTPVPARFVPAMIGAALFILLAGCSTLRVRTSYNHSVVFARFHTYTWLKVSAENQMWADRIRRDVNQQLAAKGWSEVPSGGQATINAFGSTKNQPTLETFYGGFGPGFGGWFWGGWGWGFGPDYATTEVVNTPIGTLVVDVFNSNDKHLIWRGIARDVLSGNPNKNKQKLEHAVRKMFDRFPPNK